MAKIAKIAEYFYLSKRLKGAMNRIVVSVINDLVTDQRVNRMADTLGASGYDILLVGRRLPGRLPLPETTHRIRRFRMIILRGPLFYAFFNMRLFLFLLFTKRPSMLLANDLDTLAANMLVSTIRRIPLLYDSHEYFTEVPELVHRPHIRRIWEFIESMTVPKLRAAMTVSPSIAKEYEKKYGVSFTVVRNVSHRRSVVKDPDFNDRYPATYKLIYQGALNMGRGLELLISSMKYISDTTLLIVGDGDIRDALRKQVRTMELEHKVFFLGRVPPEVLHKITCQCHLGISLEEDLGLNYRMALPNKIFDYIQARIPVLCSNLPEMAALVQEHGIGAVCPDRTPEGLARQILSMLTDRQATMRWKKNLEAAAEVLCWENERHLLEGLVSKTIEGNE